MSFRQILATSTAVLAVVSVGAVLWFSLLLYDASDDGFSRFQPKQDSPLSVLATGQDFEWWFWTSGCDGILGTSDDVESRRSLSLPPNCEIQFHLTSNDYIYTFALPEFDVKQIAVPELEHCATFRTPESGTFKLMVDPLCSFRFYHDEVMGILTIDASADMPNQFARAQ